jgi:hypothetical protein
MVAIITDKFSDPIPSYYVAIIYPIFVIKDPIYKEDRAAEAIDLLPSQWRIRYLE